MGDTTKIEWSEATWNPWQGCTKISPGCKFCYMYTEKRRYGQDPEICVRSKTTFNDPLKWVKRPETTPQYCFTCSWSDFFIDTADPWREEAWAIIRQTPQITYQILTKRPERIAGHLPADWGAGYPNVWLGVSVESHKYAQQRIPPLLNVPAAVRWLSMEPLLELVDLTSFGPEISFPWLQGFDGCEPPIPAIDWVVVGGESGDKARPFLLAWARAIVLQCQHYKVPVFVKQMGSRPFSVQDHITHRGNTEKKPEGFYRMLRDKKGGDPAEWPEDLRVREFPR